jgi:hypothetical protein
MTTVTFYAKVPIQTMRIQTTVTPLGDGRAIVRLIGIGKKGGTRVLAYRTVRLAPAGGDGSFDLQVVLSDGPRRALGPGRTAGGAR